MNLDKKILELYNNKDIDRQLNKLISRSVTTLNFDEIESIKLETIWKCIESYNEHRGIKFSTYLCRAFINNLRRESNKFKPGLEISREIPDSSFNKFEFIDSLSVLPEKYKSIIIDKFIDGLNNSEIAKKYEYSNESARRNVNNAIFYAKHRVYGV